MTLPIRNYLLWISVAAAVVISGCVAIHIWLPGYDWIANLIGVLGSIASLGGILLAIAQIRQSNDEIGKVATIANATASAVAETRLEISNCLTVNDVGHLCEKIKSAQRELLREEHNVAHLLLQSIKDDMLRIHQQFNAQDHSEKVSLEETIFLLGDDIESIFNYIDKLQHATTQKPVTPYKVKKVNANLEKARETLLKIENILKSEKL